MVKRGVKELLSDLFTRKKTFDNCYSALSSIKVRDIMIKDVLCIRRNDKLLDAAHIMIGAHASCLVVLEHETPIGIITERDFVKKLSMTKEHNDEMIVNDLMTKKVFTVSPNANLLEAQKIMREHKFRKLVIVENNILKGIITQTDLCKAVDEIKVAYHNPPLVRDVMSTQVLAVAEDDQFLKAKKIMNAKDIGSVLVITKGVVKGIFTEFDLVSEFFMNLNRLRSSYIKDLMTVPVMCISPFFDLFQANKLMLEHNFRRLPVVYKNRIVGMITQTDVAKGLYEFIERKKEAGCKPAASDDTPIYCMKKSTNIIVCERAVPINVTEDSGDENEDQDNKAQATWETSEKIADKIDSDAVAVKKPQKKAAKKSKKKLSKNPGKPKAQIKPRTGIKARKIKKSAKPNKPKKIKRK